MKIGINARYLAKTDCGNVTYILNLIRGLAKYDKQNEYIIFTMNDKDKLSTGISQDNFQFVKIKPEKYQFKSNLEWDLGIADTEEYQRANLDILHCTHFVIPKALYKNPSKSGVKVVSSIHDIIPSNVFRVKAFIEMGMPFQTMSSEGFILRMLEPKMIKRLDKAIVFSEYVKRDVTEYLGYPEGNICVIPHFPASYFEKLQPQTNTEHKQRLEKLRIRYSLPKRFIMYFSGYHKRKNVPRLIKVFKRMAKEYKDIYFVFAGTDSQVKKLRRHNIPNAIFTGTLPKEDLSALINLSEFTISPSLSEGFGLSTVESMKCGKICLCSQDSPMEEVSGNASLYFNPRDENEIYNTILKIIENPCLKQELEKKSLERINLFTEENHIKKTLEIYKSLY